MCGVMMMVDLTKTRLFASCDPVRVKRIERMVNDKGYMAKHIKRLMLRRARDYRAESEGEIFVFVDDVFEFMGEIGLSVEVKAKKFGASETLCSEEEKSLAMFLHRVAKTVISSMLSNYVRRKWVEDNKARENEDHHGGLCLQHDVTYDGKKCLLSTVKLPFSEMYETMLFAYKGDKVNYRELFCKRYEDREDAAWGHFEAMGRLAKDGSLPDPDGEVCLLGRAGASDD
jgi:hypothetical protein